MKEQDKGNNDKVNGRGQGNVAPSIIHPRMGE